MKTTKDKFLLYEDVKNSGQYNMVTDCFQIINMINISLEEYIDILQNYQEYKEKYL